MNGNRARAGQAKEKIAGMQDSFYRETGGWCPMSVLLPISPHLYTDPAGGWGGLLLAHPPTQAICSDPMWRSHSSVAPSSAPGHLPLLLSALGRR